MLLVLACIFQYAVQTNKTKRQSDVLMLKVTPGEQLHKAMIEIEDLTEKLEQQRQHYDTQVMQWVFFTILGMGPGPFKFGKSRRFDRIWEILIFL